MEPHELSISQASVAIASGELSPTELLDSVITRIESIEPQINAYDVLTLELARHDAAEAAKRLKDDGTRSRLLGIPLGVKSLIDRAGVECTSSSRTRRGRIAPTDATVVARLKRSGAVLIGQAHTHEFAYGCVTPGTRNPWNLETIPGGSSGGSAAAVAAGMGLGALGTDTAGSIRIPSAFCGVTGLKPTWGRVPRAGVTPLSWSLDHVGPIARDAADVGLILQEIAGPDPADPTCSRSASAFHAAPMPTDLVGITIGVPSNYFFDHVNPEVEIAVREAIQVLHELGATLCEVTVPATDLYMPAGRAILMSEASAWHQQNLRSDADDYGQDVRLMLETGEMLLATDYINAQRARTIIQSQWQDMFTGIDLVVAPTVPMPAPHIGVEMLTWADETVESVADACVRFTCPSNLTGLPALSLPCGFSSNGLPFGLQLIGRPFEELELLRVGQAYQEATSWPQVATNPAFV